MIIEYPALLQNKWLKEGCFIGVCSNPKEVYQVTSIIQNNGVRIKYKPYYGLLSLSDIYYIPSQFVYLNDYNKFFLKKQFEKYYLQHKNELSLKYKYGIAQCNICKKRQNVVNYCSNGSYFCKQCKNIKKSINLQNIYKYIDTQQPVNYSNTIVHLINLFSDICFQKMNDISKVEQFLGVSFNILVNNNVIQSQFQIQKIVNDKKQNNYNICKIKDSVFYHLGICFLNLHNGSKKDKYIYITVEQMKIIIRQFLLLYHKSF